MKAVSPAGFQDSRRAARASLLSAELEGLLPEPEPEPPPPAATDDEAAAAELAAVMQDARDFLGLPPSATPEEVQRAFAPSNTAFGRFFFPHYHEDEEGREIEPSRMQNDLQQEIEDLVLGRTASTTVAMACPREHGKTVTMLKGVIWATANKHRLFPIVFSDTGSQASGVAEDIRAEIEGNVRLRAVYPEYCTWSAPPRISPAGLSRLMMGNGTLFMAAGSGKAMRGVRKGWIRPDWVIPDDIESDAEVENPKRRAKKMRWWHRVAKKLGRKAVYLILGTILHAHSFLSVLIGEDRARIYRAVEVMPSATDLWAEWEGRFHDRSVPEVETRKRLARAFYDAHRQEMDAGAVVLWPARFSLYDLMLERAEDYASFLSERQNDPFDPKACYFPEDKLLFLEGADVPPLSDVVASAIMWDPSRGTSKSDTSAMPRVDALRDGRRFVSWAAVGQFPPEEMIETGIGQVRQRAVNAFGVERVGLSSYDEDLTRRARELGIALPVVPVTPTGDKNLRIRSERPLVMSGGLVFAASLPVEAVQQIKYWPQHPNDDLWDAIQQANKLLDELLAGVKPAAAYVEAAGDTTVRAEDAFGRERLAGGAVHMPRIEDRADGVLGGFFGNMLDRMFG